ncbi:MAG: LysM peptidoglycan-binding domain-containing protein, partial [Fibrobacterales bacterium]|nr:LysM peptidoglycan-binding domain-containing protein [Fibrobacterales bacterium]
TAPVKVKPAFKPYTGPTKEYVVKGGDSLGKIAYANGITIKCLKEMNGLKSNNIRIGQKLKVPAEKPVAERPVAAAEGEGDVALQRNVGADRRREKLQLPRVAGVEERSVEHLAHGLAPDGPFERSPGLRRVDRGHAVLQGEVLPARGRVGLRLGPGVAVGEAGQVDDVAGTRGAHLDRLLVPGAPDSAPDVAMAEAEVGQAPPPAPGRFAPRQQGDEPLDGSGESVVRLQLREDPRVGDVAQDGVAEREEHRLGPLVREARLPENERLRHACLPLNLENATPRSEPSVRRNARPPGTSSQ